MIKNYIDTHKQEFLDDLIELLKIPSVSTDPTREDKMQECASFVAELCRKAGLPTVEIMETGGHPAVFASWTQAPNKPTVLVYGHYDVQPEDPIEGWDNPPFEPTIIGDKIYARGATDDKGQFLVHLKAVESWLKQEGELPVNVKILIEGEEEIGSPNLQSFLEKHKELLKADVLVVSDSSMFAPGVPSIVYGLRGICYIEVEFFGASGDLHSGTYGGVVPNPAFELAKVLAKLKDDNGVIQVPGFYDKVVPLTPTEREEFAKLPNDDEEFRKGAGCLSLEGEIGYTNYERRTSRPTLEINGLLSGFTGIGAKTVLPAKAMAKISCRLVPDQNPKEIAQQLQEHIQSLCPDFITCKIKELHGGDPWITPIDHPSLKPVSKAIESVFDKPPVFAREGGSIPIATDFQKILGVPGVFVGFGLNDENLHAPNEHFSLSNFYLGIETSSAIFREMADYEPKES